MEGSPTERAFRAIESELDSMLAVAIPLPAVIDLAYTDRSTRIHDYNENYLRWEAVFERQWQRDLFTQQAEITPSFREPIDPAEPPMVYVFRRVESFRQGQVSSRDDKHKESSTLEIVRPEGSAGIIKPHLAAAAPC